jgi:hypothetical protein
MPKTVKKDIWELFNDSDGMDRALAKAVREALLQHKRMGNPIVVWRDGKIVWLSPEEIEIPEEAEDSYPLTRLGDKKADLPMHHSSKELGAGLDERIKKQPGLK